MTDDYTDDINAFSALLVQVTTLINTASTLNQATMPTVVAIIQAIQMERIAKQLEILVANTVG